MPQWQQPWRRRTLCRITHKRRLLNTLRTPVRRRPPQTPRPHHHANASAPGAAICPAHPQQRIGGTGKKYYLHVLSAEELKARGMPEKKAKLVIQSYPVLVLGDEWLEELFCPACGTSRWCHVSRDPEGKLMVRWAERELWQQVAHVDPLQPNPTVSEFSRRQARRLRNRRPDGSQLFERL
jgi:hypothetical protein